MKIVRSTFFTEKWTHAMQCPFASCSDHIVLSRHWTTAFARVLLASCPSSSALPIAVMIALRGFPLILSHADICGLQPLDQSLLGDFCCGACAHTYGSEHDERKSQIKYSDKKRVARFREYADVLYEKRGMDEALDALIGDIVLDDELSQISKCDRDGEESRGWAEVHWRPPHARAATAAEADGRRAEDEEGGSVRRAGGHDERLEPGERA